MATGGQQVSALLAGDNTAVGQQAGHLQRHVAEPEVPIVAAHLVAADLVADRFDESLPQRELHIALQAALARLDLVTREEFDAQTAVLLRTRQKLEALEQQLAQLES